MKHITVPLYLLREWHRHYRRIVEKSSCDPADTKTVNAMRLARKDLCRMGKYINKEYRE